MSQTDVVALLVTDLVGSTELHTSLGEEAGGELRRAHDRVLVDAVSSHGGTVVKGLGDGIMAAFDGAADALAAAVSMQQGIERLSRRGPALSMRVGVSVGDVTWDDADCFGVTVIEATRLCQAAEGGQILAADLVRAIARGRGGYEFNPVGSLSLKGLPEPVRACRVVWAPVEGPAWPVPLPVRLRVPEESLFVGRADERAAVAECLKRVGGDGGRVLVLVEGEAGIGKTALVSVVARDAHAEGALVLYGRSDEALGIPYQPWVEALADLVEHAPERLLGAHVDARGGDLVPLVPGLGARVRDVPAPQSSDRETERHLLFAAVLDLLSRAASEIPMVLVLDDLHWADRPSLQLLRHVAAASAPMRLLVLGTFRAADVGAEDPLAEVLAALHREQGVERLSLGGLGDMELLALLQAAAGHEMTDEGVGLRDALLEETDGNPFFVLEILRHLAETGAISQRDDGRWVAQLDLSTQGLPVSVREVIGRRVHRLGVEATRVLSAASVIGRDFDVALLSAAVDTDEGELLDVLDASVGASVIADAPGTPGRFSFVHTLIQRALYDEMTTARRQRLHGRIAQALETLPGNRDERVGELAHHWYAATQHAEVDKALGYSIAAGDRAQNRLAPDEAVRWYAQALGLVDQLDESVQDQQRCDVLLRLGAAQRLAGRAEFRQTLLDAARLARRLADTGRLVEAVLTNTRGIVASVGRVDPERMEVLRAALEAVGTPSPGLRARLLAQSALETMYAPEYDTDALISEALTLTETGDDPHARWHALHALYMNFVPQNIEQRRARQAEYLDLTPRIDPSQQLLTFVDCIALAMQSGEIDQARGLLGEIDRVTQAVGDPLMRWAAEFFRASLALLNGDIATGEHHTNQALQIALDSDQPDAMVVYGSQLIELRSLEGREEQICDLVAQVTADNPGIPAFRGALAMLLAASNRFDEARALLDEFAADTTSLWVDPTWTTGLRGWVDAVGRTRHAAAARAIVPLLAPFADQWVFPGSNSFGPIALAVGIARTVLRDYPSAETDFAQALDMAKQAPAPYYTARTLLEWAIMLISRARDDDHGQANALLAAAIDIAREHGFAGIERRAHPLLDQLR